MLVNNFDKLIYISVRVRTSNHFLQNCKISCHSSFVAL